MAAIGLDQEAAFAEALLRYGDHWTTYVDAQQEALIEYINEQIRSGNFSWTTPDEISKANVADYPRFNYSLMGIVPRLELALPNVLLLVLWNVVLLMFTWTRFMRYDLT